MENNRNLKERISDVYRILSGITVSGDNVDMLAAARAELRRLYNELPEDDKREERDGDAG